MEFAEHSTWRKIQKENFTDSRKLLEFLNLSSFQVSLSSSFPLNLPRRLAEKIEKSNLEDPILKQFLPRKEEDEDDFSPDPVLESTFRQEKKLLQKYDSRVLLITTSACAMNCRFCFRRHFDYEVSEKGFDAEINAIEKDSTIAEVILSGGDPLSLSDSTLQPLFHRLSSIPHLKRLRFHTRFPIGIPERIDTSFLTLLKETRLQVFFVIHTNHPRELDEDVLASLKKIQCLGIPVLSQTVLLKGVNDDFFTLKVLCERLADNGIVPYYLHQLDRVKGAAHFDVEEEKGLALINELASTLSGYAVPKYVKEIAGKKSKTNLHSFNGLNT